MLQATDGNWYGYFADKTFAQEADQLMGTDRRVYTSTDEFGLGLDFGLFCKAHGSHPLGFSTLDSDGIAIPANATSRGNTDNVTLPSGLKNIDALEQGSSWTNGTQGTASLINCQKGIPDRNSFQSDDMNVIRENKTLNRGVTSGVSVGNGPGIHHNNYWPFIQLYTFSSVVDVQYNRGGGTQTVTLDFNDSYDDYAGLTLDRTSYPKGAEIHLTLQDAVLNIDPTDEDVWTFGARSTNASTWYGLFDEAGTKNNSTDNVITNDQAVDLASSLSTLGLGTAVLTLNNDTQSTGTYVTELKDNDFTILTQDRGDTLDTGLGTSVVAHGSLPITFTETAANTGIFTNYDDADSANLKVSSSALRGTTATISYDGTPQSILVAQNWGEITLDASGIGDEWNSGEALAVTLVDGDMNFNSLSDDDLSIANADHIIPTVKIGSPITLADISTSSAKPIKFIDAAGDGTEHYVLGPVSYTHLTLPTKA